MLWMVVVDACEHGATRDTAECIFAVINLNIRIGNVYLGLFLFWVWGEYYKIGVVRWCVVL